MYTYVLVSNGCERSFNCVLQHTEKKSLVKLWEDFSQEKYEHEYDPRYRSIEFDRWLVEKHGFARLEAVIFDTDYHDESEG